MAGTLIMAYRYFPSLIVRNSLLEPAAALIGFGQHPHDQAEVGIAAGQHGSSGARASGTLDQKRKINQARLAHVGAVGGGDCVHPSTLPGQGRPAAGKIKGALGAHECEHQDVLRRRRR